MAIARVQYPTPYASSAKSTTHSLSWTSTTGAGNLLLCCVGFNEEGSTVNISSLTGGSGSWTLAPSNVVERTTAGVGQLKGAIYYKENAAAQSGSVTLTIDASHHATIHLVEYSGVAISSSIDTGAVATNNGSSTTPDTGTGSTSSTANELWAGFVVAKNVNANTTPTNGFTLVGDAGQGTGGGAANHSAYLEKIVSATAAPHSSTTVSASVDWVGMVVPFKQASAAATVQWTALGSAGAPEQFPLGPPDMTGATTITDSLSTKDTLWTPTDPNDVVTNPNKGLRSGVDYIIMCPYVRTRAMMILGGRNVYVPQYLMRFNTTTPLAGAPDGWMVGIQGGDASGIVHFDTVHLDNNRLQCDAFKTFKPNTAPKFHPGGSMPRTVQIRNCVIEKLVGRSTSTTGAAVHADLFQTSGGCGDIWIEDFTGSTEYDGFMFQQEANCEDQTTYWGVTAASSAGANYTFTTGPGTSGTTANHTLQVGNSVVVYDVADSNTAWYGGFTINAITSTTFTVARGDTASPGALPAGARVVKIDFAYLVGSINFNRVNVKGFANELTGGTSLQSIRFGARTAPQPNAGNPGNNPPAFTLGLPLGHVNEDRTPLNYTAWGGTLTATNWYGVPDSGNIADWVEPDSNSNNYSVTRPTQHAAAGGQPAYADWASHPQVTAGTKFQLGPPSGGDYVSINSSGIPVPRIANPTGGAGVSVHTLTQDAAIGVTTVTAITNAYDTFTRSVGAGSLGTANLGGTYTLLGTAGDYSVNGTAADIALTAVATRRATLTNLLMTTQYATMTAQTDTAPAVSYTAFDVYLRFVDTNNWFRCRFALYPSGLVQVRWDRNLAGVNTTIKAFATVAGLTASASTDYTILASAVDSGGVTTLSTYVYYASAPPPLPVPVTLSVTDTSAALQVASSAGIGCALNTGSTATTTDVLVADWGVWPSRMTSTVPITVGTTNTRFSAATFSVGTGSKHKWTPR